MRLTSRAYNLSLVRILMMIEVITVHLSISVKSSFTTEPYIKLVQNRNQRSSLTRLRISAHTLASELLRRAQPVIPMSRRFCAYCQTTASNGATTSKFVDTEHHFMVECGRFGNTRNAMFEKVSKLIKGFKDFTDHNKFLTLMCPTTPQLAKQINRYIRFMLKKREEMNSGAILGDL